MGEYFDRTISKSYIDLFNLTDLEISIVSAYSIGYIGSTCLLQSRCLSEKNILSCAADVVTYDREKLGIVPNGSVGGMSVSHINDPVSILGTDIFSQS